MKILFALGSRIVLATDGGAIIVRDGSKILFQFQGDRIDKINDAVCMHTRVRAMFYSPVGIAPNTSDDQKFQDQEIQDQAVKNNEVPDQEVQDRGDVGFLVPILRVHLNETLGRHFANLAFRKLIRLRDHFNIVHKIGAVIDTGDCVVFLPVSALVPVHGPLLTSPLSTQLALELVQRSISVVEFGYKAVEKSPCVTQDLLWIRSPHPNVIGIEEVEQRRTFNRAANLLGLHPDINQHCMFPEQLRDRDIMKYMTTTMPGIFDDEKLVEGKEDPNELDWSVDDTFLFLGYQPGAAYCSLRRSTRHSWRANSLKRSMIFSHPLLSTAFNPQQRVTGYAWHPTDARLLAVTDSFGRLSVWDVQSIRLVCYHKATRELQAAWPSPPVPETTPSRGHLQSGEAPILPQQSLTQESLPLETTKAALVVCMYYPSRGLVEYLDVWTNTIVHQTTTIRDGIISERDSVHDLVFIINLETQSPPLTYPIAAQNGA
ncbi:hypothetical protein GNI_170090 [Gregarina niphandrodes]|uniref:Uncharacterized protein n=1 Tax=Gregarina niphandrodes TaxID=110365 RepID=A0A023AXV1_GRENI|nr:hypothetical protein GNI_170090 [Gregarina niphandrodes]EZG43482.1 hypothetical protein GNI_170090 [Gregarina niphandrodes]|eukprot:XP_011133281.1 hypothetical protein GNI_170090 [Gregarina niphandrodes]